MVKLTKREKAIVAKRKEFYRLCQSDLDEAKDVACAAYLEFMQCTGSYDEILNSLIMDGFKGFNNMLPAEIIDELIEMNYFGEDEGLVDLPKYDGAYFVKQSWLGKN